ncbi:hypothetical protein ACOXXX_03840 [Thalassococcus sp. BH17M4-6]
MTAYQNNADRVQQLGPQTIRQTGTVNYEGKTKIDSLDPETQEINGFFIGDIELAADFDDGSLSGTATNFEGEVDGEDVTLDGTLDTANTDDPNVVTQTDIELPANAGTITQGNLIANMRGDLTESINNQTSTVQLSLIGSFSGSNAEGAHGAAAALVGDENSVGFGFAGGGTFYLERQ